jgi:flagellar biosynthesis GTPase FlhF
VLDAPRALPVATRIAVEPAPVVPTAPLPVPVRPSTALVPARVEDEDSWRGAPVGRREAMAVVAELVGRGMSVPTADAAVSQAAAHELPFTPRGDLREAVRRAIARRLPVHAAPPADDVVIAVVGTGGSGKTTVVAGLAAAYSGAGSLPVSCVALGRRDGGSELSGLVGDRDIALGSAATGTQAARQLRDADQGLFLLDASAVNITDAQAVESLSHELSALVPDEVLVTLPATLSARAAQQQLAGLSQLSLTGIVLTHVDETDQIGMAVELACASGTPLAFVADSGRISRAEPNAIAARLLP